MPELTIEQTIVILNDYVLGAIKYKLDAVPIQENFVNIVIEHLEGISKLVAVVTKLKHELGDNSAFRIETREQLDAALAHFTEAPPTRVK